MSAIDKKVSHAADEMSLHRYMVSCEVSGGSRVYTIEADTPDEACALVRRDLLSPGWHGDVWADLIGMKGGA